MAAPDLIVAWNLTEGSTPFDLVIDAVGPTTTNVESVSVDWYFRYDDEPDAPLQFLGTGVLGNDFSTSVDLDSGRDVRTYGFPQTSYGQQRAAIQAGGVQYVFTTPDSRPDAGTTGYIAGEAITVTDVMFVNLYDSGGGVMKFRKANATNNTKPCHGFILETVALGDSVAVYELRGQTIDGVSGVTPGTIYYLSTTGGGRTTTPTRATGNIIQQICVGKAGAFEFDPQAPITVA